MFLSCQGLPVYENHQSLNFLALNFFKGICIKTCLSGSICLCGHLVADIQGTRCSAALISAQLKAGPGHLLRCLQQLDEHQAAWSLP